MEKTKLVFEGAEARVFETKFLGQKAILKKRLNKKYRAKELDRKIIFERTKQECLLISKTKKVGVRTPFIFYADKKTGEIIMEQVLGKTVLGLPEKKLLTTCRTAGKDIAKMHNAGIIHGDLTSANILLCRKKLVFVDFGLGFFSNKEEDKATDLLVLKRILNSEDTENGFFEQVLMEYSKQSVFGQEVAQRIKEIEKRARYA